MDNNDIFIYKVCDCCKNKEEAAPSVASGVVNTNRQNHTKYFPDETLDKYVDKHDNKCNCWCCLDSNQRVAKQNANLGITIGFG